MWWAGSRHGLESDLLLGLDWFVVIGHKWNDYRNVIREVYPKLFGACFARNIHRRVQFALSYTRRSTAHRLFVSLARPLGRKLRLRNVT
jgi:hypothetical protein